MDRRLGSEVPRIFTPPARELTPETSDGYSVIEFAEKVLEIRLFPWQRWLLTHALELDESGLYRFRTVVCEVARQNGKTLLMVVLALYAIYVRESRTVIGTAQDLANAERAWKDAVEWARSNRELDELIDTVTLAHPKVLRLITGCEYRVASATRRGGRGFSGDLVLMDELREHQSWDSWAAVTKTAMARPRAQTWCFSNAGDAMSLVLRFLRAQAHRDLGWPDGDGDKDVLGETDPETADIMADSSGLATGWFEWSAPLTAKRSDRQAWAQANPSLNHVDIVEDCITERALAHALRTDPPHVFEVECLCRWTSMAEAGPFPEGSWRETLDDKARPADDAPRVVAVDVSWNRSRCYIARAANDDGGNPVVGIAADRAGTDWVVQWLLERRDSFQFIVIQSNGAPSTALIDEIESADEDDPLTVLKWSGTDLSSATGIMFDYLDQRKIRHLSHPGLDQAATSASVRTLGAGGWVIDRKNSPTDAAPLQAAIGAVWGLTQVEQPVELWAVSF